MFQPKIVLSTLSLSFALSFAAVSPALADDVFGKRPQIKDAVQISQLLEHPEKYLGREIKIQGIAMDVCPMRGCWMKIKSDKKRQSLLVKVKDGEMVFPMSARGKHTVIQGKLLKRVLSVKQQREMGAERAKETGKSFDPKSITQPKVLYSFSPTGVVIQD